MAVLSYLFAFVFLFSCLALAQTPAEDSHMHHDHEHHGMSMDMGMRMDMDGSVMNENVDQLPRDCSRLAGEVKITVHAGRKFAAKSPGTVFGYDQREWNVPPCSKVTVTLINDDNVRHQWMIHGLPRYLYTEGMFHVEVNGKASKSGTFIVPSSRKTYLVHCDVAQHMEKGMKAELKIGGGAGDLPSIPGVSPPLQTDLYRVRWDSGRIAIMTIAGLLGVGVGMVAWRGL